MWNHVSSLLLRVLLSFGSTTCNKFMWLSAYLLRQMCLLKIVQKKDRKSYQFRYCISFKHFKQLSLISTGT
jgi:hypothetical protein